MTKSLVFKLECSDRGNYCVCQFDPHSDVLCHMLIAKRSFFCDKYFIPCVCIFCRTETILLVFKQSLCQMVYSLKHEYA